MPLSRTPTSSRENGPSGAPRGKSYDQRYKEAGDKYGMSPWYGDRGTLMPNAGGPSARGKVTPWATPDAGNPMNAGYYVPENTSMDASIAAAKARNRAAYAADPAFQQAQASGDLKAQIAAMTAAREAQHRQNFIDQGGQGSTWDTRFQQEWPVPASPSGNYQYGPGRPGPTPPGVAGGSGGGPMGGGAPPGRTMPGMVAGSSGGIRRGGGVVDSPMGGGGPTGSNMIFQQGMNYPTQSGGVNPYGMQGRGYNPGASTGTAGLYGDPSMYSGGAMPVSDQMYRGPSNLFGGGPQMGSGMINTAGLQQFASPYGGGMQQFSQMPFQALQSMATQGRTPPPGYPQPGLPTGPRMPVGPYNPTPVNPNPPNRTFGYQQPPFQGQMPTERMGGMLGIPGFSPYGGGYY